MSAFRSSHLHLIFEEIISSQLFPHVLSYGNSFVPALSFLEIISPKLWTLEQTLPTEGESPHPPASQPQRKARGLELLGEALSAGAVRRLGGRPWGRPWGPQQVRCHVALDGSASGPSKRVTLRPEPPWFPKLPCDQAGLGLLLPHPQSRQRLPILLLICREPQTATIPSGVHCDRPFEGVAALGSLPLSLGKGRMYLRGLFIE